MKNTFLHGWKWIFIVVTAIALLGCLDEPNNSNAQSAETDSSDLGGAPAAPDSVPETVPTATAVIPPANLSPAIAEVVKLAESGVGDDVLLAYINKAGQAFNPTVEEIVYLKDLGLSGPVLASLVRQQNGSAAPTQAPPAPENIYPQQVPASANMPSLIEPSSTVAAEPQDAPLAAPQEIDINYFENTLAPYGTWVDVPDYGRCWQPTVVSINRSWRPYGDRGRWIYTTAGWYWQSDYSWGWAPFHYGRWFCDNRIGWVWAPDSTWGPSWVSWRYTDDYCGWAPLPPGTRFDGSGFRFHNAHVSINFDFGLRADFYTFLPTSRLCDRSPHRYYVSGNNNRTVYNKSVVINNYVRGNNNRVINEGIGRDRVSRATHAPIRTVALHDLSPASSPIGHAERLEGNSLTVFRPHVSTTHSVTHSGTRQGNEATTSSTQLHNPRNTGVPLGAGLPPTRTETVRAQQNIPPSSTGAPVIPGSSLQNQTTRHVGGQPSVTHNLPQIQTQRVPSTTLRAIGNTRAGNNSRNGGTVAGQFSAQQNPPVQAATPRNVPSIIVENPRQREAAIAPQPSFQSGQIISPRNEPTTRREVVRPNGNDASIPRSMRSLESQRQQSPAPGNFNPGSSVERYPQPIQSPRAQESPTPRSQPAQHERAADHSDHSSHDRNKK